MRLIVPSAPEVVSTNVAASALGEWSAGTTYAAGAKVRYTAVPAPHHEFESLADSNVGHPPAIDGDDWWLDLGATNQHKMFDSRNNSRTVSTAADGSIRVVIRPPGRAGAIALLGMKGARQIVITQTYGGQIKSTDTVNLLTVDTPTGLWTYFFGDYRVGTSAVRPIPGAWYRPEVTVDILPEVTGVPAECGTCFMGQAFEIGETEWGATPGIIDYSTFEKNVFGETRLVTRQNVRETDFTVWTPTDQFDRVFSLFETVSGILVLIDANNSGSDFDSLRVFGKITSFRPGLRYGSVPISIRIEGVA